MPSNSRRIGVLGRVDISISNYLSALIGTVTSQQRLHIQLII